MIYAAALAALAFAVLGPLFAPDNPAHLVGRSYTPPGGGHLLGTDDLGRDIWSRVLAGGRSLIVLPLIATGITCGLGAAIGITSGYLAGRFDRGVTVLTGLMLVIPSVLVLLVILDGWGYSDLTLIAAVVVTGTPFVTRLARATTFRSARSGYVEQAAGLGESTTSILVREIAPNVAGPLLADAGMRLVTSIEIIATAAFLGFGPDTANWATMVNENLQGITLSPWSVAAPAAALAFL
ncbi:MAG: ABC transporter permease, partial [Rhodanobacter sp.]